MNNIELTREEIRILLEALLFSMSPDIINTWSYNFDDDAIKLIKKLKQQLKGTINAEFQNKLRIKLIDNGNGMYEDKTLAKEIKKLLPEIHIEEILYDGEDEQSRKRERELEYESQQSDVG